jgi:hypothetical protein
VRFANRIVNFKRYNQAELYPTRVIGVLGSMVCRVARHQIAETSRGAGTGFSTNLSEADCIEENKFKKRSASWITVYQ